jgi:proline iminopeptidase
MELEHCLRSLVVVGGLAGCLDVEDLVHDTVDDDPALPAIDIAGTRLHAEAFGDPEAPLIIVLHGGPGSDYRGLLPLAPLADDGYRVVFWDQRGAGLSRRHDRDAFTLDIYLEDLRLVVEHYTTSPAQPILFIGHSWGAMYATWFIDTYGDYGGRIRGAVLSEPGAFTAAQLEAFLKRQLASVDFFAEPLNDIAWQDQFLTASDHARADYLDTLGALQGMPSERNDPTNPAPLWRSGAVARAALIDLGRSSNFDWTTHLGAFTHPVLFLRGDLNTAATLEHQQELAAAYPNASIVTMERVGHDMQWERPDEYLADVRTYLATLDMGGAR